MTFEIVSASNLPFDAQSEIFNRTFSGYLIGWSDIGVGGLAKLICVQGIDLCYSRFAICDDVHFGSGRGRCLLQSSSPKLHRPRRGDRKNVACDVRGAHARITRRAKRRLEQIANLHCSWRRCPTRIKLFDRLQGSGPLLSCVVTLASTSKFV